MPGEFSAKTVSRHAAAENHARRKVLRYLLRVPALAMFKWTWIPLRAAAMSSADGKEVAMRLPRPETEGTLSVERAIRQRRTVRSFSSQALDLRQLSRLLWAAQGITGRRGIKRASPSAGALFPMDVYAVVGEAAIQHLPAGIYHYEAPTHGVSLIAQGDLRQTVARASLSQMWMARAPLNIVITAEYDRARSKYGRRGARYAMIEAGHIGQNLFLQAEALNLKAGIVGAFHDRDLIHALKIPEAHEPLLVMPVGYAA
jgi:SagB-type dehydrogenase family enzyme